MSSESDHMNGDENTQNDAMKQFYVIITIVFIVLIVFLGFFIYNLIKCYLPKWRGKRELVDEQNKNTANRIEFEEV